MLDKTLITIELTRANVFCPSCYCARLQEAGQCLTDVSKCFCFVLFFPVIDHVMMLWCPFLFLLRAILLRALFSDSFPSSTNVNSGWMEGLWTERRPSVGWLYRTVTWMDLHGCMHVFVCGSVPFVLLSASRLGFFA